MDNIRGILLLILAMVGFTIEDLFIKQLSASVPVGQILIVIGTLAGAVFVGAMLVQRQPVAQPVAWTPKTIIRALAEGMAALCFSSALALVDISVVAAVFQATPLVITMGAALFLGEQVGWRRWSAICVGFAGVLVIIRPGFDGFDPNALLVLGSVLAVTVRDLLTRRLAPEIPASVLSIQACGAVVVAGFLMMAIAGEGAVAPTGFEWTMLALGGVFYVIAYYGIVTSVRIADVAVVMPFRYSRLVFSMIGGFIVFGERPDAMTVLGSTMIIGSGLYTFVRERRLARAAQSLATAGS